MKKRILIVDDDKLLNKINEKVLVAAGLVKELHVALNGMEALEYLRVRINRNYPLPEIIIMDLHMPVMDGFEFLDRYAELDFAGKGNIEIVVFTSSSSPKDRQKASERGIKNYLNKPYLLRGLNAIVTRTVATG
ncbi:MAG TPA: response regulator [Chryseosolibacter sp.]|nr:response regulator [Chryseosolibacter sp.]